MRFEADEVSLVGGIRHGRTLGLAGRHRDRQHRVAEVGPRRCPPTPGCPSKVLTQPRPGHADLAGMLKYGLRRRPRRARAGLGPRDGGPGGGRDAGQAAAGPDRVSTCSATSCSWGRPPRRPDALPRVRRTWAGSTQSQVRCCRPGGRDGGWWRRSRRRPRRVTRSAGWPRSLAYGVPVGLGQPRALGPPARRAAGPGAHEHPGRQGGRDRRRRRGGRLLGRRPTTPSGWPTTTATPTSDRGGRSGGYVRDTHRAGGIEGGISHRRAPRGPGGHEAAGHAQPAGARARSTWSPRSRRSRSRSAPTSRPCRPWAWWPRR